MSASLIEFIRRQCTPPVTDAECLRRFVASGDPETFRQLVSRHGPMVLRICQRQLGRADADDAFQAVFLTLSKKASSIRQGGALAAWLHGTAVRICGNARVMRARRHHRESLASQRIVTEPVQEITHRELLDALDAEVARLPEQLRAPLILVYWQGRTHAEAVRELNITLGALTGRLDRGRKRLARQMAKRGFAADDLKTLLMIPPSLNSLSIAVVAKTAVLAEKGVTVPATVAALVAGGGTSAWVGGTAAVVVLVSLAAVGLATLTTSAPHNASQTPNNQAVAAELDPDALPAGAIGRLGSTRMRHVGLNGLSLSPDGTTVSTVGRDRFVRYWDVATGKQIKQVRFANCPDGKIQLHDFAPDGRNYFAYFDGKIGVWDTATGQLLKTRDIVVPNMSFIWAVPNSTMVAIGSYPPKVDFWNWEHDTLRTLDAPRRNIGKDSTFHAKFSPDGKRMTIGGGLNHAVYLYDVDTFEQLHHWPCSAYVSEFSRDGHQLAISLLENEASNTDTSIQLIDLKTGKETNRYSLGHRYSCYHLAWSRDNKFLVCGAGHESYIIETATGKKRDRLPDINSASTTFSPRDELLVSRYGNQVCVWDVAKSRTRHELSASIDWKMVISRDGKSIVTPDWNRHTVNLWDMRTSQKFRELVIPDPKLDYICNLTLSADEKSLAGSQVSGALNIWDMATGEVKSSTRLHEPGKEPGRYHFHQCYVAPNLKTATSLERTRPKDDESTRLAMWDVQSGALLHAHDLQRVTTRCAWLNGGTMISLALADGISIRDVATGKTVKRLQPASEDCGMAVSPDERLLAASRSMKDKDAKATSDVAVWDLATGQLIAVVPVDQSVRFQIANDNQTLVTADDQKIVAWDIATGQVRSRWELPNPGRDIYGSPPVNRLLISADGRRVVTSMLDGTALVWDLTQVPRRPTQPITTEALSTCCDDLKHENAAKAYAAIWRLIDSPAKDVVAMLRSKLKPADDSAAEKVRDLIKKLDSDKFAEREGASRQIAELGSAAEPVLRWTLEQELSAEARRRIETLLEKATNPVLSTDDLAAMRAVQVVERLATQEARELLTYWAKGAPHAPLTREAKAANERLNISQ